MSRENATETAGEHHVAPVAPRPAPEPEERRAELLAAKSIEQIAEVIRDHIARSANYGALANCDPAADAACRTLLSQAIYEAMDLKVMPQTAAGELGLKNLNRDDADAIFATVGRVLTESEDKVERASALMLVRSMGSLPLRPLPAAAYRNLSDRTVVEAQLTLQLPLGAPIPYPEVPGELVSLFTNDSDARVQDAALGALAYHETEQELLAAVDEIARRRSSDAPEWLASVAPAIGTCGMACLETVKAVLDATNDDPAVAEGILRACPEAQRAELAQQMKTNFELQALVALARSAGVEL